MKVLGSRPMTDGSTNSAVGGWRSKNSRVGNRGKGYASSCRGFYGDLSAARRAADVTRRIHVDKGYRGHNHPHRFRVWISGQVRRVTASIRREMKRRAAVEPVIGHVKAEHRMNRNYLKGRKGDRMNAVLAAAGYNFGLLLRWLAELLRALIRTFVKTGPVPQIA